MTSILPLGSNFDGRSIQVEDRPVTSGEEPEAELYIATPGYLEAMEIPVQRGRSFTERDKEGAPLVALVSETFAERYWPGENPVGKRIRFPGSASRPQPWREVVGVVKDVKQRKLDTGGTLQMYLPLAQYPSSAMTLVVRAESDPAADDGGGPKRGSRSRPGASGLQRLDDESNAARFDLVAPFLDDAARRVRGRSIDAGGRRHLRRHLLLGHSANARDRHTSCARRKKPRRAQARRRSRAVARAGRRLP